MLSAPFEQETAAVSLARVLIVDDDPYILMLLRRVFQDDYKLVFAENGEDALSLLKQQTFDLVLLDVNMPGMNGFDVLRDIRSRSILRNLPVILISALTDSALVVQGLKLGANDYITKPLDTDVIRARISTQLALKRSTDEREQTIAQLKFTQEMQENFCRIISHDLKGPLTNIRMAQFMLRDILSDNPEAHTVLDNMDLTLNAMVEMIRVFLDAMDAQQLEPKLEALEVHDVLYEVIEQYRIPADRKSILLTMDGCACRVLADHRLLKQVLANLVSNALKFSSPQTQTRVWAEERGSMVRVCVSDGGPGIPGDERDLLFGMFSKLSPRPTAGEGSTGLGLWIVKQLTELQGGRVGVD